MAWITRDDFIETYTKLRQRGPAFLSGKLTTDARARTRNAFDDTAVSAANWWIVPRVRRRWNRLITGDATVNYKQHLLQKHLAGRTGLRLLSLGSGVCSHELELARAPQFARLTCVDIADNWLAAAARQATAGGLSHVDFVVSDVRAFNYSPAAYDVVLFNSSLHHFARVEELLTQYVRPALRPGGLLVINEYVGPDRMQFPAAQVAAVNAGIGLLDRPYRQRFRLRQYKTAFSGPGKLRMRIADPSECVDSAAILPSLRRHFNPLEERPYGGNLLPYILKDIAHHFVHPDARANALLTELFALEDAYLQTHASDFAFGVYATE